MVSINYATREVTCKIVYYGPGLSGKTTNLIYVHEKVPSSTKGKLISLATEADRTLYFDFLPINIGQVNGFTAKFQLYTVPGQVYYNATRKLVLRGVDGLVFVADSQADKMDENIESLTNLKENLAEYGYDYKNFPIVIQYNKRDLPGAMTVEELEAKLNPEKWKSFEGEAVKGTGVFDTLKMIIKLVLAKAQTSNSNKSQKLTATAEASQPEVSTTPSEQEPAPPVTPSVMAAPEPEPATAAPAPIVAETDPEPEKTPELTRQEAYRPEIKQEPGLVDLPDERENVSENSTNEIKSTRPEVPVGEPVSASSRPFPGSSTAGISRRERRITVSDFQPTASAPESETHTEQIPDEDQEIKNIESNMPKPIMAPSTRVVTKKRGFFKRLFGIK